MHRADVQRIILMGIVVGLLLVTAITNVASAQGGISVGACSQDCQCLTDEEARALWGSGSVKCAEVPCGARTAGTGDLTFTIYSYCYRAQRSTSQAMTCPQGYQCLWQTEAYMVFGPDIEKSSETPCQPGKDEVLGYKYCYHAKPLPTTGGLALDTVPSGAAVYLDGMYRGITPITLTALTPGYHTARFVLAGYQDRTEAIFVTAGITNTATFALTPIAQPPAGATKGDLMLNTVPSGASVYLNGAYQGTTPVTLTGLSAGSYTATFTQEGYQDLTETVTVTAGQTSGYTYTLTPVSGEGGDQVEVEPIDEVEVQPLPETGGISVVSQPTGARVVVDDRNQGTTPLDLSGLTPGEHTVRVSLAGYEDQTRTVMVIAGQSTPVPFTLRKSPVQNEPDEKPSRDGPMLVVTATPPKPAVNALVNVHGEYSLPVNNPAIEIYVNDRKEKECTALSCDASFKYTVDTSVAVRFRDRDGYMSRIQPVPWGSMVSGTHGVCPCSIVQLAAGMMQQNCRDIPVDNTGKTTRLCEEPKDGCLEYCDNCPTMFNPAQENADGDDLGDRCDPCPLFDNEEVGKDLWYLQNEGLYLDISSLWDLDCSDEDKDNIPAFEDSCPQVNNNDPAEDMRDQDGVPDACDKCLGFPDSADKDHDDIPDGCDARDGPGGRDDDDDGYADDGEDNCPGVYNPDQAHSDSDQYGDACDNCWNYANPSQDDTDGDCAALKSSNFFWDSMNDAWVHDPKCGNGCDKCPGTINRGFDGPDKDGVDIACDSCWSVANPVQKFPWDSPLCLERAIDPNFVDQNNKIKGWIQDPKCGPSCSDQDGDRIYDAEDNCPTRYNPGQYQHNPAAGDACLCLHYPNVLGGGHLDKDCQIDFFVPIHLAGPGTKLDIVIVPDQQYYNYITSLPGSQGWNLFHDDAMDFITEAWSQTLLNNEGTIIGALGRDYLDNMNVYMSKSFIYVDASGSESLKSPIPGCAGFESYFEWADAVLVLHLAEWTDWSNEVCGVRITTAENRSYGTMMHELGHGVFKLKDEYYVFGHKTAYANSYNIFDSPEGCQNNANLLGVSLGRCNNPYCPSTDEEICNHGHGAGWYKVCPEGCVMQNDGTPPYEFQVADAVYIKEKIFTSVFV